MYWNVGKYISDYVLDGKDRAKYGANLYQSLSKDLDISEDTLQRAVRFSREFPISAALRKLTWSHYVTLLSLPDRTDRRKLLQKAINNDLNTRDLQAEINKRRRTTYSVSLTAEIPILKAQRGQFHTYTVIEAEDGVKYLDCGFDVWHYQPSVKPAAKNDYTYRARVQSVVDGDTLWVVVDLGFNNFTRQKLRLRGIDCPELEPSAKISKKALEKDQLVLRAEGEARTTALKYPGQAAKRFVQSLLKPKDLVVIRTQKGDDKYGRYLCDIWCGEGEKEVYLNQELLNRRLAVVMRE